ncbi:MAG: hypothetical protein FVQ77_12165 [Cytophagales bacterium]|nr:hypothetical protein [Cytophagales bacterium]
MQAIRKIIRVQNGKIQIKLPFRSSPEYVEVIILPFKNKNSVDDREEIINKKGTASDKKKLINFQKLLLEGPVMSDEDYNYFVEKRNHFNQWK